MASKKGLRELVSKCLSWLQHSLPAISFIIREHTFDKHYFSPSHYFLSTFFRLFSATVRSPSFPYETPATSLTSVRNAPSCYNMPLN